MRHPESFKSNSRIGFKGADRKGRVMGGKGGFTFGGRKHSANFERHGESEVFEKKSSFGARNGQFGKNAGRKFNEVDAVGFNGDKKEGRNFRKEKWGGCGEKKNGFGNRKFDSFDSSKHDRREQRKNQKDSMAPRTNEQRKQVQPSYEKTQFVDYSKPMRLNRFLANAGVCSRREADEFIQAGVVTVNGQIITELGTRVVPADDKVMFHDQLVKIERRVYILLNKPKDYVTTADDPHAKQTVMDLVKGACAERLYPVGRLDRNTTGVLLLTNDGELTAKLTHPSFNKKKIYQVTLDKDVTEQDVEKITTGITLEDGDIKVDEFSFVKEGDFKTVGVEIHSGRNRIVRRIFESLGYRVVRLDRVYFAGLTKKNLPRGKWRFLSEKEVVFLKMNANNPNDI